MAETLTHLEVKSQPWCDIRDGAIHTAVHEHGTAHTYRQARPQFRVQARSWWLQVGKGEFMPPETRAVDVSHDTTVRCPYRQHYQPQTTREQAQYGRRPWRVCDVVHRERGRQTNSLATRRMGVHANRCNQRPKHTRHPGQGNQHRYGQARHTQDTGIAHTPPTLVFVHPNTHTHTHTRIRNHAKRLLAK